MSSNWHVAILQNSLKT